MKFCKDCKHYDVSQIGGRDARLYANCKRAEETNPVTGGVQTVSCAMERVMSGDDHCTKVGQFFEPKEAA